jgi:hypothetical protein
MEMTGYVLIKMGMPETCLGKPVESGATYFYSDGLVFQYIDNKTDLELEERECRDYLNTNKYSGITSPMDESFDETGTTGIDIVRDVLEEIRLYRYHVLRNA